MHCLFREIPEDLRALMQFDHTVRAITEVAREIEPPVDDERYTRVDGEESVDGDFGICCGGSL